MCVCVCVCVCVLVCVYVYVCVKYSSEIFLYFRGNYISQLGKGK